MTTEQVDHPSHYTQGAIECIDAIEATLGREQFIGFLRGQVIKYQWRVGLKGDAGTDAAKANWYGRRLTELLAVPVAPVVTPGVESAWIEWKPGTVTPSMPMPPGTPIEYKLRNGVFLETNRPQALRWTQEGLSRDIIAYRILPS